MAGPPSSSTPLIFPPMVYIDTVNGYPLVGSYLSTVIGTPNLPVNNLTDAITIAAIRDTPNFHIKNALVLDRNLTTTYNFFGDNDWATSYVNLNGFDCDNATFNNLGVLGSTPGFLTAVNCMITGSYTSLTTFGLISGSLFNCSVGSMGVVPGGFGINCYNCQAVDGGYLGVTLTGGGQIGWVGGGGQLYVNNADNAASLFIAVVPDMQVWLQNTCANGTIYIGAAIMVTDNSVAPCLVYNYTYIPGKRSSFTKTIVAAANAGLTRVVSVVWNPIWVDSIIIAATGNQTANLTTAGVYQVYGAAKVNTLISPVLATQANLATIRMQQQGVGPWLLHAGDIISVELLGTGPAAVNLELSVMFRPANWGGHVIN